MISNETIMQPAANFRSVVTWFGATMTVVLTTALLAWFGARSTAGMVFLVLVVWTATRAGVALSLFIAVLCALSFDYFFLPPFHTLVLAGAEEWVAMFSFLASSIVAGRVAERARMQATHAEQRREDVERLYTLSQEMMLYEDAARLTSELPLVIQRVFGLEDVALYIHDLDKFSASSPDLPMSTHASLAALTHTQGMMHVLPGEITAMPLMLGMRQAGALGWRPAILSREVATAMTAQVAIALTRALAIEASARLEAAREGERLRTALIDSLTHELRTPLTSIRAAATTLIQGDGLDDASRADLAAIVDEESARLDSLIGEAVEMAELDANVLKVQAVSQDTRTFLHQVVEHSENVLSSHHVVILAAEPDDSVWFDPQLLARVFRHLLENAARYSPPGSRIVLRSRHNGDRLEFSVEDNGPGIDPVDLPLIFEKFYRGKMGAAKGTGTGMGLAITRAILSAHGGGIEVSSQPGQGTTFRFWIPLVVEEPAPAQ
jgi:two-component system, OmpR family, sensor histidine kinase KdpD